MQFVEYVGNSASCNLIMLLGSSELAPNSVFELHFWYCVIVLTKYQTPLTNNDCLIICFTSQLTTVSLFLNFIVNLFALHTWNVLYAYTHYKYQLLPFINHYVRPTVYKQIQQISNIHILKASISYKALSSLQN